MTTIRGLMLAQQQRHPEGDQAVGLDGTHYAVCSGCYCNWPCDDREAADAVLAQLKAAATVEPLEFSVLECTHRLVPDPGVS